MSNDTENPSGGYDLTAELLRFAYDEGTVDLHAAAMVYAYREVTALRAKVGRVEALHRAITQPGTRTDEAPDGWVVCHECDHPWPCGTHAALESGAP